MIRRYMDIVMRLGFMRIMLSELIKIEKVWFCSRIVMCFVYIIMYWYGICLDLRSSTLLFL